MRKYGNAKNMEILFRCSKNFFDMFVQTFDENGIAKDENIVVFSL